METDTEDTPDVVPWTASRDPLDLQRWYRKVHALCRSKLLSVSDADDATQETFVRAIQHSGKLQAEDAFAAWIRRVASNVCVDMIRRRVVRKAAPIDDNTAQLADQCDEVIQREQHGQLLELIRQLPENQREVIYLYYYEKMTYDEMAEWLKVARSTVNERLTKARERLRQQLAVSGEAS